MIGTLALLVFQSLELFAAARPPNILLAVADDWGRHAGAYGTPWVRTPAVDRVARNGLLFDRAHTPNAKCAPSRACILTGRNSWQLKEAANHICYFPPEFKTWMEALAEHGWFTGHTLKGWGPGEARTADGRPRQMTGPAFNRRTLKPPTDGISGNDYAANFADFLDAAATNDKPWCFWFGAIEPHRGYEYGSGVAKGGKKLSDIDRVPACWPDNEIVRNDLLDYAFEVEYFDNSLAKMLNDLDRRGLLSNTLVIVTSDHGMPFPRSKGNAYELANHVPLAVMWPAGIAKPGRRIDDFVSFIDFAPTVLELAGLTQEKSGMAPWTGRSLVEIFRTEKAGSALAERDHVLIGKERTDIGRPHDEGYPTRGIVTADWLYVRNHEPSRWPAGNPETGYLDCDGGATKSFILDAHRRDPADRFWALCFGMRPGEELYDLRADPDCVNNLAANESAASTRARLADAMTRQLTAEGDPRMAGQGQVFDAYEHANRGHVGFYERFMRGEKIKAGWVNPSDVEKEPSK